MVAANMPEVFFFKCYLNCDNMIYVHVVFQLKPPIIQSNIIHATAGHLHIPVVYSITRYESNRLQTCEILLVVMSKNTIHDVETPLSIKAVVQEWH